ncbi:MAG TPA: RNA polymerase subunit sigma-70 [Acidimicrobiales bacterium]|nr:RNA polymerase subunit sigma-70 [Acidimicrobiales bacterium]
MNDQLLNRAQSGDQQAFAQLTGQYRRELQVHCYRILGSVQDAEDALQQTLLGAWQSLGGFEERASVRTWLYRIATNRCLNMLRASSRRPQPDGIRFDVPLPEPTRVGEVVWLEPYPDLLLEGLPDDSPGPEVKYEARESVSLAFVAALQLLSPRQRVALVLRDVLGFRANEVSEMIGATESAVENALKRARVAVQAGLEDPAHHEPPPAPESPVEQEIVRRLTEAFEVGDVEKLVQLLAEDVRVTMPPMPLEYRGREPAARFFSIVSFRPGRRIRIVEARANGQPAVAAYVRDPQTGLFHANGVVVLTLSGRFISALTGFDKSVLPAFGLPRVLSS